MSSLDLDINNYDKEELIDILNVEDLNESEIIKSADQIIAKMLNDGKKDIAGFIGKAKIKLLTIMADEEDDEEEDDNDEDDNDEDDNENDKENKEENSKQLNPFNRTVVSKIFAIDSIFRDIDNYPNSTDFIYTLPAPIDNVISMKLIDAEIPNVQSIFSDEAQNNILRIKIYNGKRVKKDVSNNREIGIEDMPMDGSSNVLDIKIPEGSPTVQSLILLIQNILDSQRNSFSLLKVWLDDISGKFYFRFKTLNECNLWNNIYYSSYSEQKGDLENNQIVIGYPKDNKKPTSYFKLPSNFSLEIDEDTYKIEKNTGKFRNLYNYDYLKAIYIGALEDIDVSLNDPTIIEYFANNDINLNTNFIQNDLSGGSLSLISNKPLEYELDFNPNKVIYTNTESLDWLLGFRNDEWKSKRVSYYDTLTRGCIEFNGYISANTPYGDGNQNYIYIHVDEFAGNYTESLNASTNEAYLGNSLLARIQMDSQLFGKNFISFDNNTSFMQRERLYHGPVNIEKLHIKFLDIYGNIIYFNKSNYALTFQFEKYYNKLNNVTFK